MSLPRMRKSLWTRLVAFPVIFCLLAGDVVRANPSVLAPRSAFQEEQEDPGETEGTQSEAFKVPSDIPYLRALADLLHLEKTLNRVTGKSVRRMTWEVLQGAKEQLSVALRGSSVRVSFSEDEVTFYQEGAFRLIFDHPEKLNVHVDWLVDVPEQKALKKRPAPTAKTWATRVLRYIALAVLIGPMIVLSLLQFPLPRPSPPQADLAGASMVQISRAPIKESGELTKTMLGTQPTRLERPAQVHSNQRYTVDKNSKGHSAPGLSVRRETPLPSKEVWEEVLDRYLKGLGDLKDFLQRLGVLSIPTGPKSSSRSDTWLSREMYQGLELIDFLWKPNDLNVLRNEAAIDTYIAYLKQYGYTHVLYGAADIVGQALGSDLRNRQRAELFLQKAHANGIRVSALLGDPTWADPHFEEAGDTVYRVLNSGLPWDAVSLDIEGWVVKRSPQDLERVKSRMQKIGAQFNRDISWFTLPGQQSTKGVQTLLAVYETDPEKMVDIVASHKAAAESDYVIVVEAGKHAEKSTMSFHGREERIPYALEYLLKDPNLALRGDPHFKGFAIHRDDDSTLQAMVDDTGEFRLFEDEEGTIRYYRETLWEYVSKDEGLTPYGTSPPTWAEKAKEFVIGGVKGLLGGFFGGFMKPFYTSAVSSVEQSEARGEITLVGSGDGIIPGAEVGFAYKIARGIMGLTHFDPGNPKIHDFTVTAYRKGTNEVVFPAQNLMQRGEPLRLPFSREDLKDLELEFGIGVSGGTRFRELDAYVQLDIVNARDPRVQPEESSGPFRVKGDKYTLISIRRPATILTEGVDAFSVKLINDKRVVAQVGGYDVRVVRDMLQRLAADFGRDTVATTGLNRMGLEGSRLGLSVTFDSERLFFVQGKYDGEVNNGVLEMLRASGVSQVLLNGEDLLSQGMPVVHFQRLVDTAREYGIEIIRLTRLQSRERGLTSPPPIADGLSSTPITTMPEDLQDTKKFPPDVKVETRESATRPIPRETLRFEFEPESNAVHGTLRIGDKTYGPVMVNRLDSLTSEIFLNAKTGIPVATRDSFGEVLVYDRLQDSRAIGSVFTVKGFEVPRYAYAAKDAQGKTDHVLYQMENRRVLYYPAKDGRAEKTVFTFQELHGSGKHLAELELAGDKRKLRIWPVLQTHRADRENISSYQVEIRLFDSDGAQSGTVSEKDFSRLGKVLMYRQLLPQAQTRPGYGKPFWERDADGETWSYLYASRPDDVHGRAAAVVRIKGDLRQLMAKNVRATMSENGNIVIHVDGQKPLVLTQKNLGTIRAIGGVLVEHLRVDRYDVDYGTPQSPAPRHMARLASSQTALRGETYRYEKDPVLGIFQVVEGPTGTKHIDSMGNLLFAMNPNGLQKSFYTHIPQPDGGWLVYERQGTPEGPLVQTIWKDGAGRIVSYAGRDGIRYSVKTELAANHLIRRQEVTDAFGRQAVTEFYVYGDEAGLPKKITDYKGSRGLRYTFDPANGRVLTQLEVWETDGEGRALEEPLEARSRKIMFHTTGTMMGLAREASGALGPAEAYAYDLDALGFVALKKVDTEKETRIYDASEQLVERISRAGDGHRFYTTTVLADGGRRVVEQVLREDGSKQHFSVTVYDKNDNEVSQTDAFGLDIGYRIITHKAGPMAGLPKTQIDRFGNRTQYQHTLDDQGRLIRTESFPEGEPDKRIVEDIAIGTDPAAGTLLGRPYRSTSPQGFVSQIAYELDATGAVALTRATTDREIVEYNARGEVILRRDTVRGLVFRMQTIRLKDGGKVVNTFVVEKDGQERFVRQGRFDKNDNTRVLVEAHRPKGPKIFVPLLDLQGKKIQEISFTPREDSWAESHFQWELDPGGAQYLVRMDGAGRVLDRISLDDPEALGEFERQEYYTSGPFEGKVSARIPKGDATKRVSLQYALHPITGEVSKEIQTTLDAKGEPLMTTIEFADGLVHSIEDALGKKIYEVLRHFSNGQRRVKVYLDRAPEAVLQIADFDALDRFHQWPIETAEVTGLITATEEALETQAITARGAYDGRQIMTRVLLGQDFDALQTDAEREAALVAYNKVINHLPGNPIVMEPESYHAVKTYQRYKGPLIVLMRPSKGQTLEEIATRIIQSASFMDRSEGDYQIALDDSLLSREEFLELSRRVWEMSRISNARLTPAEGNPLDISSENIGHLEILLAGRPLKMYQTRTEGVRLEVDLVIGERHFKVKETLDGGLQVNGIVLTKDSTEEFDGLGFTMIGPRAATVSLEGEQLTLEFLDSTKRFPGFRGLSLAPVSGEAELDDWRAQMEGLSGPTAEGLARAVREFTMQEIVQGLKKKSFERTAIENLIFSYFGLSSGPTLEVGSQRATLDNKGYAEFTVRPGEPILIPVMAEATGREFGEHTVHWALEDLDSERPPSEFVQQIDLQGDAPIHSLMQFEGLPKGRYRITGQIVPRQTTDPKGWSLMQVVGPQGETLYPISNRHQSTMHFNGEEWTVERDGRTWVFRSGSDVTRVASHQPAVSVASNTWAAMSGGGIHRAMGLIKKVDVHFATTEEGLPLITIDGIPVLIRQNFLLQTVEVESASKRAILNRGGNVSGELSVGLGNQLIASVRPDGKLSLWINAENVLIDLSATTVSVGEGPAQVLAEGDGGETQIGSQGVRIIPEPKDFVFHAGDRGSDKIEANGLDVPIGPEEGDILQVRRKGNRLTLTHGDLSVALKLSGDRWVASSDDKKPEVVGTKALYYGGEEEQMSVRFSEAGILHVGLGEEAFQIETQAGGQIRMEGAEAQATLFAPQAGTKFSAQVEVRDPTAREVLPGTVSPEIGPEAPVVTLRDEGFLPQGPRAWIGFMLWMLLAYSFARFGDAMRGSWRRRVTIPGIKRKAKEDEERFGPVMSRRVDMNDLMVKRAFVFYGGRGEVPANVLRQNQAPLRYSELFEEGMIVMSSYARTKMGMTETEKMEQPSRPARVWEFLTKPRMLRQPPPKKIASFTKLYQKALGLEDIPLTTGQEAELNAVLEPLRKSGMSEETLQDMGLEIVGKMDASVEWIAKQRAQELGKVGLIEGGDVSKVTNLGNRVLKSLGKSSMEQLLSMEIAAIGRSIEQLQGLGKWDGKFMLQDLSDKDFPDKDLKLLIKYHLLNVSKENDLLSLDMGAEVFAGGSLKDAHEALRATEGAMLFNPAVYPSAFFPLTNTEEYRNRIGDSAGAPRRVWAWMSQVLANTREHFRDAGIRGGFARFIAWISAVTDFGGSMICRRIRAFHPSTNTQSNLLFGLKVKADVDKSPTDFMIAVKGRWTTGHLAAIKVELRGENYHIGESFTEPVRIKQNFDNYAKLVQARKKEGREATGIGTRRAALVAAAMAAQQTQNMVFPGELATIEGMEYLGNWSDPQSGLGRYKDALGKDAKEDHMDEDLNIALSDTDRGVTLVLPTGDVFVIQTKDKDKIGRISKGAKLGSLIAMLLDQFGFEPRVRRDTAHEEATGEVRWITDYTRVDLVREHAKPIVEARDAYEELRHEQRQAAQAFVDGVSSQRVTLVDPYATDSVEIALGSQAGMDPGSVIHRFLGKVSWTGIKNTLIGPVALSLLKPLADTHVASAIHAYFSPEGVLTQTSEKIQQEQKEFSTFAAELLREQGTMPADMPTSYLSLERSDITEEDVSQAIASLPRDMRRQIQDQPFGNRPITLAGAIEMGLHLPEAQRERRSPEMKKAGRISRHMSSQALSMTLYRNALDGHLRELGDVDQGISVAFGRGDPANVRLSTEADVLAFADLVLDALEAHGNFLRRHLSVQRRQEIAKRHLKDGVFLGLADLLIAWEQEATVERRGNVALPGDTEEQRRNNGLLEYGNALLKAKQDLAYLAEGFTILTSQGQIDAESSGTLGTALGHVARSLGVSGRPSGVGDFSEDLAYRMALLAQQEGENRAVGHKVAQLLYHGSLDPGVFKGGDYTFGRPGVRPLRIMQAIVDPEGYRQARDWSWSSLKVAVEGSEQIGSEVYSEIPQTLNAPLRRNIDKFLDAARNRGLFVQEIIFPDKDGAGMVVVARFAEATAYFPDDASRLREIQDVFREIGAPNLYAQENLAVWTPEEFEGYRSGIDAQTGQSRAPPGMENFPLLYRQAGRDGRVVQRITPIDEYLGGRGENTFHQYAIARSDVEMGIDDLNEFLKKISAELMTNVAARVKDLVDRKDEKGLQELTDQINAFLREGAMAQGVPTDRYRKVRVKDLRALMHLAGKTELTFANRPLDLLRRSRLWVRDHVRPWFQMALGTGLVVFLTAKTGSWWSLSLLGLMSAEIALYPRAAARWMDLSSEASVMGNIVRWFDEHSTVRLALGALWYAGYFYFLIAPVVTYSIATIIPAFLVIFYLSGFQLIVSAVVGSFFDTFFWASKSLVFRLIQGVTYNIPMWLTGERVGWKSAETVERSFRWMAYSRDIELLARIHGVDPDLLSGMWDSASWSLALGLPIGPGQYFGRIKVAERGGKIFEATPVPIAAALLNLNEPPPSGALSGFNLLPHRGSELAASFTEDTASFLGYAMATWQPNINHAAMLKREALANLIESRLYDQSAERAAQFAKARGILGFAIPRMVAHPLYGEEMKPYRSFFENMFSMKAFDEDQIGHGRDNLGAGFLQYLLTSFTGEDLTDARIGPFPPGIAEAVSHYQTLLLLDQEHGGFKIKAEDPETSRTYLPISPSQSAKFSFDQARGVFVLKMDDRAVEIAPGANPVLDPLVITDSSGVRHEANARGLFLVPFPVKGLPKNTIQIRKDGVGGISLHVGKLFYTAAVRPEGDGAILSKPGRYFKAVKVLQLLHGNTSGFMRVDHLLPTALGLSLRQKDEEELDAQITRLTRLYTGLDSLEERLAQVAGVRQEEEAVLWGDLVADMEALVQQKDAQALELMRDRVLVLKEGMHSETIAEKLDELAKKMGYAIKQNMLTERFYLPARRLRSNDALVQQALAQPQAALQGKARRFEAFRKEHVKALGSNLFKTPAFEDVWGLDAILKSKIQELARGLEVARLGGNEKIAINIKQRLAFLKVHAGKKAYEEAMREVKEELRRRPARRVQPIRWLVPSRVMSVLVLVTAITAAGILLGPSGALAVASVGPMALAVVADQEAKETAARIKETLPKVVPQRISEPTPWSSSV